MLKTKIIIIDLSRPRQELISQIPRDFPLTCLSTQEDAEEI
jgi:hypothetical protein